MFSSNVMNKTEELHLCNGALLIYFGSKVIVTDELNNSNSSVDKSVDDRFTSKLVNKTKNVGGGSVVLLDGVASGEFAPIHRNIRYYFSHQYVYLETNTKARIRIDGMYTYVYTSHDANMWEIHTLLELQRCGVNTTHVATNCNEHSEQSAREIKLQSIHISSNPRVMIVGDDLCSKLHAGYSLLNLSTRQRNNVSVAYVNVDVSAEGALRCPGSISTVFVNEPLEIDEPFDRLAALTFFFGFCGVSSASRKRYLDLCAYTAESVESAMNAKSDVKRGGLLLHTMPAHTEFEFDLLRQLVHLFKITHIVICEPNLALEEALNKMIISWPVCTLRYNLMSICKLWQENLCFNERSYVNRAHSSEEELMEVLKCSSKEVSILQELQHQEQQESQPKQEEEFQYEQEFTCNESEMLKLVNSNSHIDKIGVLVHRYFYGMLRTPLTPFHGIADLDQVILVDANTLEPIGTKPVLPNSLAAVIWADNLSHVTEANVAGFIIITEKGKRRFSFLSPASGTLPSAYILVSTAISVPRWCIPPVQTS